MKISQKTMPGTLQTAKRDAYVMPKLKIFGAVGALTQAGSMADGELMGMMCGTMNMQDPMC